MCQLAYVLSPFTHAHHALAQDQRRSQCCHLVCINYCCAAAAAIAAAARQSESHQSAASPDPGSPSSASTASFSSTPLCITFNRTTTPAFIIHHIRHAHRCPHYTNVCIEERPRDWFYHGSMLAFAVERLPRAREGYTLSWRWVWERMPVGSREDRDGGVSGEGERESEIEGMEGQRDVEGRDIEERGGT
ncbi:hypothetical protein QR685DRAFT_436143 [Neurospora intermedia]|uniref:Uncharacterized protein n=1 Tax=Neurospora intermedia TaxID=5142 RepID=A0ABR3DJF9_NEUIN